MFMLAQCDSYGILLGKDFVLANTASLLACVLDDQVTTSLHIHITGLPTCGLFMSNSAFRNSSQHSLICHHLGASFRRRAWSLTGQHLGSVSHPSWMILSTCHTRTYLLSRNCRRWTHHSINPRIQIINRKVYTLLTCVVLFNLHWPFEKSTNNMRTWLHVSALVT